MKKNLFIVIGALALWTSPLHAETITINISATVDWVDDTGNALDGQMNVGDVITGTYTYDNTTPDVEPLLMYGIYPHATGTGEMSIAANGLTLKTDPNPTESPFSMEIYDDFTDIYRVVSHINLPLSTGARLDFMAIDLYDPTGQTNSSDALPVTAPDLSLYDFSDLHGYGVSADGTPFNFVAKIGSLSIEPIEPPKVQVISPADGSHFVERQKFNMVVFLPDTGAYITTLTGTRNGQLIENYLHSNCWPGPILDNGTKETLLCVNAESILVPDDNAIKLEIMMNDGSIFNTEFTWRLRN